MFLLIYLYVFIIGLVLGSYLNSWMWRVHEKKYVFGGRSMCIHCSRFLKWFENIPVISFLTLRGKCRTCKKKIPHEYLLVELASGFLLMFLVYFDSGNNLRFIRDIFFVTILLVTFFYDAKYSLVLSGLTYAGIGLGLFFNYYYLGYALPNLSLGIGIGCGFFLIQYLISNGRWIGGGDVRLGAMMGAWLGFPGVIVALFFGYILGAAYAVPLILEKKKKMSSEIPFGTFLSIGTFIAIFWGQRIVSWYLGAMK